MHLIKEFLIVGGRIVTILPLALGITIYMGKRSVGELPIFDFIVVITLEAVVGADIADPKIEHIHTAVAIILIGLLQKLISKLKIKYRKFGHIVTFEPTIVIQDGKFIVSNLTKIHYSIDNVLQMLREKEVFDIKDVYLAIVEPNGNVSVLKKPYKTEVTIEDINLIKKDPSISYPVIVDGIVYSETLKKLNLSEDWLKKRLEIIGMNSVEEIFFASVNMKKELHVSPKNYMNDKSKIMPVYN
ncbi:hypothetical protein WX45_00277 [Clostridium ljungdahlii DSM 13528]|uniref:YetF C-terminal domain-containing protein n=1 Tax=Clostridium ljungdahlii (strain ATCC 55383 / DSM 13528 / PETC) TaxID=748727 RepID=D8GU11_CLOLD|nr:DUF421 domain-containing protein [Clostridium ljungdahlii]ADK16824.1 conserved hypothetical protein [Clostridium ljungdahlii DSM 13528]OAA85635.1 hypothetical protein WX45_00277 [Clostridium ljungdahlii DSM 13528]